MNTYTTDGTHIRRHHGTRSEYRDGFGRSAQSRQSEQGECSAIAFSPSKHRIVIAGEGGSLLYGDIVRDNIFGDGFDF
jgi:hypothetical protein